MYTIRDLAEKLKMPIRRVQEIFKPRGKEAIIPKINGRYKFTEEQFNEIIETYFNDEESAAC